MRVGTGYDIHRLIEKRKLVLGGIEIPFKKGLLGWSDGDVALHAIIDALLGAAALGDIGTYFPSTDPQYKDISSLLLLRQTSKILEKHNWCIGNVDVTIIAQKPELNPFIDDMRNQISQALAIKRDRVSVKAKTSDGMGLVGKEEVMAAQAAALIEEIL